MRTLTENLQQTRALGAKLALHTPAGTVYALIGALGSGKTEFVRGFVSALCPDVPVSSPTFTIVNTYDTGVFTIHHFDFYRIKRPEELNEIGFLEYLYDERAVCCIEWADLFPGVLPDTTRYVRFEEKQGSGARIITVDLGSGEPLKAQ